MYMYIYFIYFLFYSNFDVFLIADGSTIELGHSFNSESKVLTIRKPDVNISEDWSINLI